MNIMENQQLDTRDIYLKLLKVLESFVTNAVHLDVQALKNYNPSIEELAKDIFVFSSIIETMSNNSYEDENMVINAKQCAIKMRMMAEAIRNNNNQEVTCIFKELGKLTHVP